MRVELFQCVRFNFSRKRPSLAYGSGHVYKALYPRGIAPERRASLGMRDSHKWRNTAFAHMQGELSSVELTKKSGEQCCVREVRLDAKLHRKHNNLDFLTAQEYDESREQ